ncbi:MAG: protein-L-isoaspartate(D-aspartate) O-methyltransferase [Candidatus Methylomirabilales bacterium]
MVKEQLERRGITDPRVLAAMRKVPRHLFVDPSLGWRAYEDSPLAIGEGQTISQPYMVAVMTATLALQGSERVLEIGTGSGYQTAVLAELAAWVYSIERIPTLAECAQKTLARQGYTNVSIRVSDGSMGWPEAAPFEAIVVTAGAPHVPPPLVEQLQVGGRLVIPVGSSHAQTLRRVLRKKDRVEEEELVACVFVRLVGEHGWQEQEEEDGQR